MINFLGGAFPMLPMEKKERHVCISYIIYKSYITYKTNRDVNPKSSIRNTPLKIEETAEFYELYKTIGYITISLNLYKTIGYITPSARLYKLKSYITLFYAKRLIKLPLEIEVK